MTSLTQSSEQARHGGRGARARILDAAAQLFYFEGINATGVGLIAQRAAVSKRTLYQHFPSKTALVEEYLRQLRRRAGQATETSLQEPNASPRQQLLALFDLTDPGEDRMRGCPFHNAAVEAAGAMPTVERIVHLHKREHIHSLTQLAQEAGAPDPDTLGRQLVLLYEGASALSTSTNDPAVWAHARTCAQTLIDHALNHSS